MVEDERSCQQPTYGSFKPIKFYKNWLEQLMKDVWIADKKMGDNLVQIIVPFVRCVNSIAVKRV